MLREDHPLTEICRALGWSRRSYDYRPTSGDDEPLPQAIEAVLADWPTYGYRRVTKLLQRQHWSVNHKRITRIMR